MKKLLLILIEGYILFASSLLKTMLGVNKMCLSNPSCSAFAKQAINKHGIIKGVTMALRRVAACHPYARRIKTVRV